MLVAWVFERFVFLMSEEERFYMSEHRLGKRGPKTSEGKLASSQNSKKHGLTSKKLHDPAEIQQVLQWEKELTDYYQPKSPFAKIINSQIAAYAVKSKRIREIERLELEQKVYELEHNPRIIVDAMKFSNGTVKGMLLELIRFKQIQLPCNLSHQNLKDIVVEIGQFYGQIHCEDDVFEAFPQLVAYLSAQTFFEKDEGMAIDEKLKIVSDKIRCVLDGGEKYLEYLKHRVACCEKSEPPEEPSDHDIQIMEYVREMQAKIAEKRASRAAVAPVVEKKFATHATFMKMLEVFNELYLALSLALNAKKSFDQKKDFMIASVALSVERSDLLMRYQTTIDRRLSALIGEYVIIEDRDKAAR